MPDEHPSVTVVRRLYEAFAAQDLDTILAVLDPDVVMEQTPELPWGGTYRGHDGAAQFFGALVGTITSVVTPEVVFAAGDDVVQAGRTAGTVNATGAPFDIAQVHVLTLSRGRVTHFTSRIDTPAMLEALDAVG